MAILLVLALFLSPLPLRLPFSLALPCQHSAASLYNCFNAWRSVKYTQMFARLMDAARRPISGA